MMSNKYMLINKNIICIGAIFDFSLYCKLMPNSELQCIIEKDSLLINDDVKKSKNTEAIYVNESEYKNYKRYYENYLANISKDKNITFEDRSKAMYVNASKLLVDIFKNPEVTGNYEKSKELVGDLVTTVSDDEFSIKSLASIAIDDDSYTHTHTHSINVSIYALSLASFLNFSKDSLSDIGESALLHDLGKSKIDSKIVNKKGKLTDQEFKIIQNHSNLGYYLGMKIGIKKRSVLNGIKYHHEKMDGSGYPLKLKGEDIPLFARIIGVCETFDALTTHRSYKAAISPFEALKLMKIEMKNHLDMNLVNKMIMMFR